MINSTTILYIIYIFGAYTLFYTYQNDFNVFLLTLLLALGAFWCYLYIDEFVGMWETKIQNIENTVRNKIDFLAHKLFNLKDLSKIKDLPNIEDLQNIKILPNIKDLPNIKNFS